VPPREGSLPRLIEQVLHPAGALRWFPPLGRLAGQDIHWFEMVAGLS
jgi:hypothetical protein